MSQAPTHYKIIIRGSFDVSWADYVGETLVNVQVDNGKIRSTTLLGQPIDLAAFLGTLHMLIDLGFPVVAFEYQQADPIASAADSAVNHDRRQGQSTQ